MMPHLSSGIFAFFYDQGRGRLWFRSQDRGETSLGEARN